MTIPPDAEPEVLARVEGKVGRLTLNRPKALHALTLNMIRLITRALLDWRNDGGVELVMLDHAGERGFCAGGDIKSATTGGPSREFFFEEYQLNEFLVRYPKPIAVFLDGIVMGGGVGLAMPCRYRVATEKTLFAMPETAIGLFPDVGGGWWLSRLPGESGMWLALTGSRIKTADCRSLGIVTDVVKSEAVEAIKREVLAAPDGIGEVLARHEVDPGAPPLAGHRDVIDRTFAADTVEGVVAALETDGGDWAKAQLDILKTRSPTAMKVAFRQLREGCARTSFAEEMLVETRIGSRVSYSHDFKEGVRAVLVDRDNRPQWSPSTLAGVDQAALDAIFAPLDPDQEWTPLP